MFQPNNQHSDQARTLPVQDSRALVVVDYTEPAANANNNAQNGAFSQAEAIVQISQRLQDDLQTLGMKIKQHEDKLNSLKTQKNNFEDSLRNMQVAAKIETKENFQPKSEDNEEEIIEQILQHDKSAAGILCQLKTRHGNHASHLTLTRDVVGVVATLGKVEDDNLNSLFSEYLGLETMLAVVCKTYEGVTALEMYDEEGGINKSSGLHGLGASIGRIVGSRFLVICLESLRPYPGEFILDDPQRRLDILKPRFPSGESPPGFINFAVNMINMDVLNLFCITPNGYGLRETLFYNLFSRLQVYRTRAEMIQALPCITDGALSLDGGMIRKSGEYSLGHRSNASVRFLKPKGRSMGADCVTEIEKQMKDLKLKKEKVLEDLKKEQHLLDVAKFNFNKKKSEFVKFLADSSSYATQILTNQAMRQ